MAKAAAAAAAAAADDDKPIGVCEKLFRALSFNLSFRPVRRLTHSEHSPATDAAAHPPNSTQDCSISDLQTDTNPKPDRLPPPTAMTSPVAPPKQPPPAVAVPAPPKAMAQPAVTEESEEKKSINERAAEYIKNAKIKIRSSTFGRTPTTKKTS